MDCLMIDSSDWTALTLTFELALISTIILLVIGTPVAWWLSQTKVRFKFLKAVISLKFKPEPTSPLICKQLSCKSALSKAFWLEDWEILSNSCSITLIFIKDSFTFPFFIILWIKISILFFRLITRDNFMKVYLHKILF